MNKELLRETFDWVHDNPDRWDQGYWARVTDAVLIQGMQSVPLRTKQGYRFNAIPVEPTCGTALCFAGAGVCLAHPGSMLLADTDTGDASAVLIGGNVADIHELALEMFGINIWQGDELFHSDNTIVKIHRILVSWGVLPDETYMEYELRRSLDRTAGVGG